MFPLPRLELETCSDHIEQQLESVIHMKLLMAVKKRETVHRRRHIHLDLPEALDQHDVFQNTGCDFAVDVRYFEAVPMQVNRMCVVSLIIEYQAVAPAFLKRSRLCLLIEADPVDGPAIEASFAAVDLSENKWDRFIGLWGGTVWPKRV